ncbi:TIGR00730 family Rossman fold protein [Marinomonas pollencensis]|uniref:Cytokinin riboside 5'-monophosphate phosphoribohydrolase n=1 Tax=Marinomonas pollencensis TaxID=491954 RepID=A0A3E0DIB4_9GAMM|nr:TIGR00730 family Rossman fold protein [Marinomonas pollencensis]REG82358.1 hypothetical protein DFP81_10917 [Marinomonas pollencensis]
MRVAVYCGSALGVTEEYSVAVASLGRYFAEHQIDVVYGGGHVGLMGVIANATLEAGGNVIGVIPQHLQEKEIAHLALTELHLVADMHQRKAKMAELADAFVALPGGIGTLEEIFEVWTWAQLGLHNKPCAFYNVAGFYEPLFTMVKGMQDAGFIKQPYADMIIQADSPSQLLAAFDGYQSPRKKWQ